ncbi:MAG: hypothetical protein A2152_00565 [Candidatus Levybacteria bacterium RBG_16_35_6]|nr:MAG: hypothetical protein A2152_00565 [Candidatus Levybacteria bacterium RBG_16_35_6]
MHKGFYASGFLYHPSSEQILLQQITTADKDSTWSLFEGKTADDTSGEEMFRDIISRALNIKLKLRGIFCVYKYTCKQEINHRIYYAELGKLRKFASFNNREFSWFSPKQIHKLNLSDQTRHDIVVGFRVIESSIRRSLGLRTIG